MSYFEELQQVLSRLDPSPLLDFVSACQGTLWLAGNGGSMSTAQHWACDLSKAVGKRAQALGSNPAVLTAWANDTTYALALANELAGLWQKGDSLICLSCSGTSPNIAALLEYAAAHHMPSLLVTGSHSKGDAFMVLRIPHANYGIIEDATSAIGHWLTEALCSH